MWKQCNIDKQKYQYDRSKWACLQSKLTFTEISICKIKQTQLISLNKYKCSLDQNPADDCCFECSLKRTCQAI